jgi:membrane-bound acyltransferase YfiQ involved in biofilm formation
MLGGIEMDWDRVYVTVWYAIIVLIALVELYTIYDQRTTTPPLTEVIVREVPWWVTLPFLGWLFLHFLIRYARWGEWF